MTLLDLRRSRWARLEQGALRLFVTETDCCRIYLCEPTVWLGWFPEL